MIKKSIGRMTLLGVGLFVVVFAITYLTIPRTDNYIEMASIARVSTPEKVVESYGAEGDILEKLLQVEENLKHLSWKVNDRLQRVVDLNNRYPPNRELARQAKADLLQARLDFSKEAVRKKKLVRRLGTIRVMRRLHNR